MGKHAIPRNGWPRKAAAATGAAIVTGLFVAGSGPLAASATPKSVTAQAYSVNGYWLVTSNGKVYPFGQAKWYGDASNLKLNKPIIEMISSPDGKGYWLIASDGGVFAYGSAGFFGSTGNTKLPAPVVSAAVLPKVLNRPPLKPTISLGAVSETTVQPSAPSATAAVPTPPTPKALQY